MINGEIDEDFINIIKYLDENGYRPWSSCDGVLNHHSKENKPNMAYISFLHNDRIIDLMTVFLRDKENFTVNICSQNTKKPYTYFGNIISGIKYKVEFSNYYGERTQYFDKIIKGITEGKIEIKDKEKKGLQEIITLLDSIEKSELYYMLNLNGNCKNFYGIDEGYNSLLISTKAFEEHIRDMKELSKKISEKFNITLKNGEREETYQDTDEFIMPVCGQKIILIYCFKGNDFSKICNIIEFAHSCEKELSKVKFLDENCDKFDETNR